LSIPYQLTLCGLLPQTASFVNTFYYKPTPLSIPLANFCPVFYHNQKPLSSPTTLT
jgi:hypothetical protein